MLEVFEQEGHQQHAQHSQGTGLKFSSGLRTPRVRSQGGLDAEGLEQVASSMRSTCRARAQDPA